MTDELAADAGQRLLRIIAATAMLGGGARLGVAALQNTNPRYNPPEVPKPTIVDMPYPVPARAAPAPQQIPVGGKEKKTEKAANYPDWAESLGSLGRGLHDVLPTFHAPQGPPNATSASQVPLFGAAQIGAMAVGLPAGYMLTDKLVRAADRWRARRDLAAAQREYQDAVTDRLSRSDLESKSAAAEVPDPAAADAKRAIDELYEVVKRASDDQPNPFLRTLAAGLWPGTVMGPDAARWNAMLVGAMGLGGGYMGYNYARDEDAKKQVRKQIKNIDESNANAIRPPLIARLVPVPQRTGPA